MLHDGSEYTGNYMKTITKQDLIDLHLPRIQALVKGGCDLLAIETMPCLHEVEAIFELLKEHFPETKAWVSFSVKVNLKSSYHILLLLLKTINMYAQAYNKDKINFQNAWESAPDVNYTASGDSMKNAFETLSKYPQIWGFGINCCSPKSVAPFLKEFSTWNGQEMIKPIVYPNSGQDWVRGIG